VIFGSHCQIPTSTNNWRTKSAPKWLLNALFGQSLKKLTNQMSQAIGLWQEASSGASCGDGKMENLTVSLSVGRDAA
jgi:hypothetical protein